MKVKALFLAGALLAAPVSFAQGKTGSPQRGQPGQPAPAQTQQQKQAGAQKGGGIQQRDRDRIRATDQQRTQIRQCSQSAERVRTQAREMSQSAAGANFNADQAKRQRDQLRTQYQAMHQEHQRLMDGLSEEQRTAVQEQERLMKQQCERIETQFQAMDKELSQPSPDRKLIAKQAREVELAMNVWEQNHRKVSAELGVRP